MEEKKKKNVDIDCLFMWRATVALPLWRATVAFRLCGKSEKRLLEHRFYSFALHMWRRKPNQESTGDSLRDALTSHSLYLYALHNLI